MFSLLNLLPYTLMSVQSNHIDNFLAEFWKHKIMVNLRSFGLENFKYI